MSRVCVVFTGGTIAMRPDEAAGGAVPTLRGDEIIARTPGLEEVAEVVPVDWGLVPASHLAFGQILEIAALLDKLLADESVDGAVVVQGTDTIEETAFAWDLLVRSHKPVIVTGAMRNAAEADYDGPRNLRDAVRCAQSPELRGAGAAVVLGGRVIAADQAVKAHATSIDAFRAPDGDALGEIHDGRLVMRSRRGGRPRLPVVPAAVDVAVHLVTAVTGMDGTIVRLIRQTGAAGLVVAATGAGNTHPDLLAAAEELIATGAAVVLTTRCFGGRVTPAYAFPGGGATWQRAGALLSPLYGPKARVALTLGLAARLGESELRSVLRA